jgi:hypothetical protein
VKKKPDSGAVCEYNHVERESDLLELEGNVPIKK